MSTDMQVLAQKVLIADLHAQLAKKEPLLRATAGKKSSAIAILTRAEADEEAKVFKNQITKLKGELDEAKRVTESQDKEITALKGQGESSFLCVFSGPHICIAKELRVELDAEIARANALSKQQAKAAPPSTSKGTAYTTADSPKHAKTIRLYEDLTNVLVHGVKNSKSNYGTDDWSFNCLYTHYDPVDPDQTPQSKVFFAYLRLLLC
jgi:hypothetical protein